MTKFHAEYPNFMQNLVVEHWQLGCGPKLGVLGSVKGYKISLIYVPQKYANLAQNIDICFRLHLSRRRTTCECAFSYGRMSLTLTPWP